jgi:hypothetical protein
MKRDSEGRQRKMSDAPWLWITKNSLRKIRARCEDARTTLLVYMALAECASDEGSDDFTISMNAIASRGCLTRQTVLKHLRQLEHIGLVWIMRSCTNEHFRIPSAYVLLKCEKDHSKADSPDVNQFDNVVNLTRGVRLPLQKEQKNKNGKLADEEERERL